MISWTGAGAHVPHHVPITHTGCPQRPPIRFSSMAHPADHHRHCDGRATKPRISWRTPRSRGRQRGEP